MLLAFSSTGLHDTCIFNRKRNPAQVVERLRSVHCWAHGGSRGFLTGMPSLGWVILMEKGASDTPRPASPGAARWEIAGPACGRILRCPGSGPVGCSAPPADPQCCSVSRGSPGPRRCVGHTKGPHRHWSAHTADRAIPSSSRLSHFWDHRSIPPPSNIPPLRVWGNLRPLERLWHIFYMNMYSETALGVLWTRSKSTCGPQVKNPYSKKKTN